MCLRQQVDWKVYVVSGRLNFVFLIHQVPVGWMVSEAIGGGCLVLLVGGRCLSLLVG